MNMTITDDLVEAFLKCPTKCFLRSRGGGWGGKPLMPPGFELTTKSSASKETNAWWQRSRPINVPSPHRLWGALSRLNGTCAWISPYRVRTCNVVEGAGNPGEENPYRRQSRSED